MWVSTFVLLGCAFTAEATQIRDSPVEKVITMIRDLQTQVQEEGTKEAATYDKFACFCKSKTDEKTGSIGEGSTSVETLVADIGAFSATRDQLDIDINDLNGEIKGYDDQLLDGKGLRESEVMTFEAAFEDMTKAVSSLERAIDTLKASGDHEALVSVSSIVQKSLIMADALDMVTESNKKVVAFLSDPPAEVPTSDYDFHSGDIIGTIEQLLETFRAKKTTLEDENASAKSAYDLSKQAKEAQVAATTVTLEAKQTERSETTKSLAVAQEDLTGKNAILNDDRVYLKDLTGKCETKAKEWDQRSTMRANELAAITQALAVIEGTVANKATATGAGGRDAPVTTAIQTVSFIQDEHVVRKHKHEKKSPAEAAVRKAIVSLLKTAGATLKSPILSTLATKVSEDPFVKIKGLIQTLIERLLAEEADEANHKGWCDTEISKTLKDREYRLRNVEGLHSDLEGLNARKATLGEDKHELTTAVAELTADLTLQASNREEEKAEHEETVAESKEGLEAIKQAIDILAHFYGEAAQGTVEENAFVQQSPVDDEAPDSGMDGAYTGSQSASTGVLGMLDVIKSDFERTISETEGAEEQAKRDFVEFDRTMKMSITTKETGLEHTTHELTECETELSTAEEDMRTQQTSLDNAVRTWEELLPGCVADPGMSNAERVERREAEVSALKDAYCILNNEDAGCSGVFLQKRMKISA